jgi:hypothetical protein
MILESLARHIARYLTKHIHVHAVPNGVMADTLMQAIKPGDVLLVEGQNRVSTAIKYLTQSTWSHAALYVGDVFEKKDARGFPLCLVEADVLDGVRAVSMQSFSGLHCRICRPVGLASCDAQNLVAYAVACIGHQYDLRNVFDLMRYLLPIPPVFSRWRRRMIALGSGDPTRAICSTLIAQAFGSIRYPILPTVSAEAAPTNECPDCVAELLHVRHYSLYVPRDFDVSPYFNVVKPALENEFDFRSLKWAA